jgi:hypothetical protein
MMHLLKVITTKNLRGGDQTMLGRRFRCWTVLPILLVLPLTVGAKGQGKARKAEKKEKGVVSATAADYADLARLKYIEGTLVRVESGGKAITFGYPYSYPANKGAKNKGKNPKPAAVNLARRIQKLNRQRLQILLMKDPVKRARRLQKITAQLEQLQAKLAKVQSGGAYKASRMATGRKDFELVATDDVKVRLLELPVEYDDTGHLKQFTAKERKELKGKEGLPGYRGAWENLAPGQTARLYLLPPKKKPEEKKAKVDVEDKAVFDLLDETKKPLVRMILVLAEPTDATTPKEKKRKK